MVTRNEECMGTSLWSVGCCYQIRDEAVLLDVCDLIIYEIRLNKCIDTQELFVLVVFLAYSLGVCWNKIFGKVLVFVHSFENWVTISVLFCLVERKENSKILYHLFGVWVSSKFNLPCRKMDGRKRLIKVRLKWSWNLEDEAIQECLQKNISHATNIQKPDVTEAPSSIFAKNKLPHFIRNRISFFWFRFVLCPLSNVNGKVHQLSRQTIFSHSIMLCNFLDMTEAWNMAKICRTYCLLPSFTHTLDENWKAYNSKNR